MSRRPVIVLGACVVLATVVAYFFNFRAPDGTPAAASTITSPSNSNAGGAVETSIPAPRIGEPLPSVEAPLRLTADELRRRTNAGDAGAACRLASEFAYCRQIEVRRMDLDGWLRERRLAFDMLTTTEDKQSAQRAFDRELALRENRLQALESHCDGVPIPSTKEITHLWRKAALGGDPVAMRQYSSGKAFRFDTMLDMLPELQTYKQEAESIAQLSAKRGDFDMWLLLAASYSNEAEDGRSFLSQTVKANPPRSLALYKKIEQALRDSGFGDHQIYREVEEKISDLESALTAHELAVTDSLLKHEFAQWSSPTIRGVDRLETTGRLRDVSRAWCGRAS